MYNSTSPAYFPLNAGQEGVLLILVFIPSFSTIVPGTRSTTLSKKKKKKTIIKNKNIIIK
jgi:hypothetical protein